MTDDERPPTLDLVAVHDTKYGHGGGLLALLVVMLVIQFNAFWGPDPYVAVGLTVAYGVVIVLIFEYGTRNAYQNWQLARRVGREP